MVRCVVIDDEELARQHLTRLLAAHADVEIAGEASNGGDALQLLSDCRPDVAFLDIEMPGLNGFEVLTQLRHSPRVVFATAYDEYAIRAFDANAIDYLLKPIQAARLAQAMDKLRMSIAKPRDDYETLLRRALSTVQTRTPAKIAGRRGKRIVLLSPRDILYAIVEDQIVFLHTAAERFATDRTIAELEALLASAGFVRVSRSTLVNLDHTRELLPWFSGTWKVKLSNDAEIDVSRDRARHLKARLG
jgi:DNA-binding LytR/AlgR family response regulator